MAYLTPGPAGVVHIAAAHVVIDGRLLRQRCAWCGALMLDYDLGRTASPCGDDCRASGCQPEHHRPATWRAGELVEVGGRASWLVHLKDGDPLPANACAQLDAAGTV